MTRLATILTRRGVGTTLIVFAVLAAIAVFTIIAQPAPATRGAGPGVEPPIVSTLPATWEDAYVVSRSFVGRIEAKQESRLGFEIGGTIDTITVDEGDVLAAGAVIATLDVDRLQARRIELVAARDQATANRRQLELRRERLGRARDSGAATDQEWDDVDTAFQAAVAALARADAAIATLDVDLDEAVLRAPFDAVVAERHRDVGAVVDAGTPIVHVLERGAAEARIGVDSAAAESLTVGDPVVVRVADRPYGGTVSAILPTRDRVGRSVDVIVQLDATLGALRQGDLARLEVERSNSARGFWVPLTALTEGTRGMWTVYVVESSGLAASAGDASRSEVGADTDRQPDDPTAPTLRAAEVTVHHQTASAAYVRGPVEDGWRLVASGLHRVVPGMQVRERDAAVPELATDGASIRDSRDAAQTERTP